MLFAIPDDRVHCDACQRLTSMGCAAGREASVPVSREANGDCPHRCAQFVPLSDAVDKRAARQRWPALFVVVAPSCVQGTRKRALPPQAQREFV